MVPHMFDWIFIGFALMNEVQRLNDRAMVKIHGTWSPVIKVQ